MTGRLQTASAPLFFSYSFRTNSIVYRVAGAALEDSAVVTLRAILHRILGQILGVDLVAIRAGRGVLRVLCTIGALVRVDRETVAVGQSGTPDGLLGHGRQIAVATDAGLLADCLELRLLGWLATVGDVLVRLLEEGLVGVAAAAILTTVCLGLCLGGITQRFAF